MNLAEAIASACTALRNCEKSGNQEWLARWDERITQLENRLPHGSGLDGRVEVLRETTSFRQIVIATEFHHMNEHGYYDGWTQHTVRVFPTFVGLDATVSGRDRNQIKEYLAEVFTTAMLEPAPEYPWAQETPIFKAAT